MAACSPAPAADGVVLVWDMIIGERKKKIEGWSKEVTSLQFIGATSQIVTSAGDNLIRIVNDDGTVVRAIDKLPDFMQAAASTRRRQRGHRRRRRQPPARLGRHTARNSPSLAPSKPRGPIVS